MSDASSDYWGENDVTKEQLKKEDLIKKLTVNALEELSYRLKKEGSYDIV